jgi:hypothetical protein
VWDAFGGHVNSTAYNKHVKKAIKKYMLKHSVEQLAALPSRERVAASRRFQRLADADKTIAAGFIWTHLKPLANGACACLSLLFANELAVM